MERFTHCFFITKDASLESITAFYCTHLYGEDGSLLSDSSHD